MNAVAADRELARLGFRLVDMDRDAGAILVNPEATIAQPHGIGAKPLLDGVEQDLVQIGAMDRKLRPVVAGEAPARLLEDELAVAAVESEFAGLDAMCCELLREAQLAELAHGMRQEVDADAQRLDLGRGL